jgi:glycosyltransferase involved in cell wall biosynthesis
MATVGIVVTAFNRPLSLLRTLHDLRRSALSDAIVVVVDDGSVDLVTPAIVESFTIPGVRVMSLLRPRKRWRAATYLLPVVGRFYRDLTTFTVHEALRDGYDALLAAAPELDVLVNIDSDVRLRRDWLTTLRGLFERERAARGPLILTGFHAPNHPIVEVHADHVVKQSVGGVNLLFDVETYRDVVRPHLRLHWDWHVTAEMARRGLPLLCSRPSVVQHAGRRGRFSRPLRFDQADDFAPDARTSSR